MKILEKLVYRQLSSFVETNALLNDTQSGFHAGYSTETALLEVSETVREALEGGASAMVVMLDLSAAFGTVAHCTLLNRLNYFGFRGTVLSWLQSFLEDQSQRVFLHHFSFLLKPLVCGVPQGSALSPLLFNLYLAPLATLIETWGVKVVSYADDSQLVFSFREYSEAAFLIFKDYLKDISK